MDTHNKIFTAATVSASFVLTAFVFAPSNVLLTNLTEFDIFYSELLIYLILAATPLFLLTTALALLSLRNSGGHQKTVSLLLSLSFLLWLQGNVLVWNYGLLTGDKINFNPVYLIIDAAIWAGFLVFAFIKSAFIYKRAKVSSCILIAIQLISTSILVYKQPEAPSFKRYKFDDTNKFTFSKERNVILLVLDTFQSEVFEKIINGDKSYKNIFDGFVYFRNTLGGFPTTYASVPNILTGQYYDNSIPIQEFIKNAYLSPESIPWVLKKNGFEVDYYGVPCTMYCDNGLISNLRPREKPKAVDTRIFDVSLFRYSPDFLKKYIYNDGNWFLKNLIHDRQPTARGGSISKTSVETSHKIFSEKALTLGDIVFINDMMAYSTITSGKYIFKFYHLNGCHPPYSMNENMEYEENVGREGQGKGALKITGLFLDELRRLEAFDNSMIFVIGDHGPGETLRESATPLFLVKKFNSHGPLATSDAPISLSDIPKTIFSELGLSGQFNGESVFNLKDSDVRERRFLYYNWFTPGFDDWSREYMPRMKEYFITGHVRSDDSWKATGRKFIAEDFDEFEKARVPVFLNDEMNLISTPLSGVPYRKDADFAAGFGEGWSFNENVRRWMDSEVAFITIKNTTENKQASLHIQCIPLKENNVLSIYLNGVKIKDCENSSRYSINSLTFKKGENLLEFKSKLPAARPGNGNSDMRSLCYSFEVIKFAEPYFVLLTWKDGFFGLEKEYPAQNWRWCSSEGILEIDNTASCDKKIILDMTFSTSHPESSRLSLESDLFTTQLQVNGKGTPFHKEITVPPGKHLIKFGCDARRVEAPQDPRIMIFRVNNFKLIEK